MTAFDPANALRRYHAAIKRLDFKAIEESFADDARYVSAGIGALAGRDAIMAAFRRYFAEYADQVATDDSVEAAGVRSARARWRLRATSSANGEAVERQGEAVERQGEETVIFDARGRIVLVEVTDL